MQSEQVELNGKRVIVVEDDYLLATGLCSDLRALGATVLGPAPTPFYALQLIGIKDRRRLDAAVLDVHLHGTKVFEVADVLQQRGVPFVFATGSEKAAIPRRFEGTPILQKPFERSAVVKAVMDIMKKPVSRPAMPRPPVTDVTEPPVVNFARALARTLGRQ